MNLLQSRLKEGSLPLGGVEQGISQSTALRLRNGLAVQSQPSAQSAKGVV